MSVPLVLPELITALKSKAAATGVTVTSETAGGLAGEIEAIKAKWWFGGRKVVYRMSCRADADARKVLFRESVSETSWGLPPPTVTVERETISGWQRSGTRTDTSLGGGGTLDYARVRTAIEDAARSAGWTFELEGGRMP